MARPELGTKRQCQNCGAKFYDLNKDPIVCPKCGTPFVAVAAVAAPAGRVRAEAAPKPAAVVDDLAAEENADIELVSLEDADDEVSGKDSVDGDVEVDDDAGTDDEDAFLPDDEDEDDDVTDLIGGDLEDDEEA